MFTATTIGLLAGSVIVSVVHGLLPNHWLPFVLIGRAQGWNARKAIGVLVAAGAAHMAVSGAIAMVTLLFGVAVEPLIESFGHLLPGVILLGVGSGYCLLDILSKEHHHHDVHQAAEDGMSDKAAVTTLVLSLALSPCEALVPVFVSAAPTGSPVFLLVLVVVSGVASTAVMAVLARLAWSGAARLHFGRFAHRERLLVGMTLCLVGTATLALPLVEG